MAARDMNAVRASVWQLLSSLFAKELSAERIKELAAAELWQAFAGEAELQAAAAQIRAALIAAAQHDARAGGPQVRAAARFELAADFCSAFLQNAEHCAAPYASLYLGDAGEAAGNEIATQDKAAKDKTERSLYGEKHQLMSDYLRSAGLGLADDFREPSDHLAVILALMAHLCASASLDSQRAFLESAILSWLPEFNARLGKLKLVSPLYSALGDFTLAWARLDAELLLA
ncbi:molecular chaperone TorD [Shewanella litorisediminis]|uniref:Chaperone protein TorD n=1 Tax=Shewanella litorisediminis TaxID=1173586 RepID=A0ABX7G638_9GAMM|nr:molecular chaperone TorD [Shewanella litorisediminis]MCL2917603.1 molecular chaperone TorD [Shewanella litorisediminis]QRH02728.1 molecular chaperone TorD [Shewanella litorisediminis]